MPHRTTLRRHAASATAPCLPLHRAGPACPAGLASWPLPCREGACPCCRGRAGSEHMQRSLTANFSLFQMLRRCFTTSSVQCMWWGKPGSGPPAKESGDRERGAVHSKRKSQSSHIRLYPLKYERMRQVCIQDGLTPGVSSLGGCRQPWQPARQPPEQWQLDEREALGAAGSLLKACWKWKAPVPGSLSTCGTSGGAAPACTVGCCAAALLQVPAFCWGAGSSEWWWWWSAQWAQQAGVAAQAG